MHLRFRTELNQLESVTATERLILEMEQIKQSAFDQQQNLAGVHQEIQQQKARQEKEAIQKDLAVMKSSLEDVYSNKLKQLLESQTEATMATTAIAKQLGELQVNSR